jgi:hypothetical protein
VVHLRIVAPGECSEHALELLKASPSVQNVVLLPNAAQKPPGDLILCDVAREDTSVILSDLRELGVPVQGSIALEMIDTSISDVARAAEKAAAGLPSDAVVWEEVESRTSENTELSINSLAFMVLAMLIASVGLILDSPILIIGGMVVGPSSGRSRAHASPSSSCGAIWRGVGHRPRGGLPGRDRRSRCSPRSS